MKLADEDAVVWDNSRGRLLAGRNALYYNPISRMYETFFDSSPTTHTRYQDPLFQRAFPWKASDGVVHITERMEHPVYKDAADRITICNAFRLNKYPQGLLDRRALDIVPCKEPVTCIICIGLKDFTDE